EMNNGVGTTKLEPRPFHREEELFNGLALGIRDYFRKTGHSRCVIGLSGGIDSAVTACVAVEALGKESVICVAMPSRFTSQHSVEDAAALARNLGIRLLTIGIDDLMGDYDGALRRHFEGLERDVTEENIQARIRGNLLMAFSNKFGYLVLSTGNKTELALGYCTLYGDMSGGLAVISDLTKTDVYAVATWYNQYMNEEIIPRNILKKSPSAELAEGQVDPFDYDVVSPLVEEIVERRSSKKELIEMGYDGNLVDRIYKLIRSAEFKRRQAAPGLRVTSKAFGLGRRYPIVNHFDGG
ncbi:MAG: NAD(+) synthase, partial [Fidelibacterota bacterium]